MSSDITYTSGKSINIHSLLVRLGKKKTEIAEIIILLLNAL